jgi:hypothetical protein
MDLKRARKVNDGADRKMGEVLEQGLEEAVPNYVKDARESSDRSDCLSWGFGVHGRTRALFQRHEVRDVI